MQTVEKENIICCSGNMISYHRKSSGLATNSVYLCLFERAVALLAMANPRTQLNMMLNSFFRFSVVDWSPGRGVPWKAFLQIPIHLGLLLLWTILSIIFPVFGRNVDCPKPRHIGQETCPVSVSESPQDSANQKVEILERHSIRSAFSLFPIHCVLYFF